MISRCYNKSVDRYPEYGGRGICVCEEWLQKETGPISFINWAITNGYSEALTLDRKDVNGNYTPDNCRWVDWTTQARNRRKFKGKELPVGVSRSKGGRYTAHITEKYKAKHLGTFDTVEEARTAYERARAIRDGA